MDDCFCDYDPAEFYSSAIVRARRPHKCDECGLTIEAGERYERVSGKWEGDLSTFKTCAPCVDLRTWVKNNVPCFCWAHGNLHGDARDTVDDARCRARDETRGLLFGLLRRIVLIRRRVAQQRSAA